MYKFNILNCNSLYQQIVIFGLLILVNINTSFAAERIDVLKLPDISQWETESFAGETQYEVITVDGEHAIKANSDKSASGLVRHIDIDLTRTPYLNWSWKINQVLQDVNETEKSGDDYAARIYVVISGGVLFWRTRAISYAWSSMQTKGQHWPNAFTENATMIAVESGNELAGQWVKVKRNILEDIKNILGLDKTEINAVAIMTDTDNSKQSATAYYRDIYFTSE